MGRLDSENVVALGAWYDALPDRSSVNKEGLSPPILAPSSSESDGPGYYEAQSSQSAQAQSAQPIYPTDEFPQDPQQSLGPPLPNYPPTAEDWQVYRAIFTQLYNIENRTLKDVMQIMEGRFGFRATRRMYLQRINKWDLCKNNKQAEHTKSGQTHSQHEKHGRVHHKATVRARPARIKKEPKDKGPASQISEDRQVVKKNTNPSKILKPKDTVALLDELRQQIMNSSSPLPPLSTPFKLKNAEMFLAYTNIFYDSFPALSTEETAIQPYDFSNKLDAAFDYLNVGQQKAAWRILNDASDMVQPLLASNNWRLMQLLVGNALDWSLKAPVDAFKSVFTYISSMATLVLGRGNPISVVCTAITSLDAGDPAYMPACRLIVAKIEAKLGSSHKEVLQAKDMHGMLLTIGQCHDEAQSIQRELLRHHLKEDPLSQEAVWAFYRVGLTCEKLRDWEGAVNVLRHVLDACQTVDPTGFPFVEIELVATRDLYPALTALGREAEAELIIEEKMNKCLANHDWEPDDWRMVLFVGLLERCLRNQGKIDEADRLKEEHPEAF